MVSKQNLTSMLVVAAILSFVLTLGVKGGVTGMATSTAEGNVTMTITGTTSLKIDPTKDVIAFGSGTVTDGQNTCTLNSESTATNCDNFTTVANGFQIYNDGNTDLNITVTVNQNTTSMLGSTGATNDFEIKMNQDEEAGSCTGVHYSAYATIANVAGTSMTLCDALSAEDANDLLELDVQLSIDSAAPAGGAKTALFTFTGTS